MILAIFAFTSIAFGATQEFNSPIPSSVEGISIPNTHELAKKEGRVLRGQLPKVTELKELGDAGVTDVLILRADSDGEAEVADELKMLKLEPRIQNVVHIPLKWRDIRDYQEPCRQLIQGLRLIRDTLNTPNRTLYVHCTLGEDRTGVLAGLYKLVFEDHHTRGAFKGEMCRKGYAEGDHEKPRWVSSFIHSGLTPIYLSMAKLIQQKKITADNLDENVCRELPFKDMEIRKELARDLPKYTCRLPPMYLRNR